MKIMIKVDDKPLLNEFIPINFMYPKINGVETLISQVEVLGKDEGLRFNIGGSAGFINYYIEPGQKLTFEFKPGA